MRVGEYMLVRGSNFISPLPFKQAWRAYPIRHPEDSPLGGYTLPPALQKFGNAQTN